MRTTLPVLPEYENAPFVPVPVYRLYAGDVVTHTFGKGHGAYALTVAQEHDRVLTVQLGDGPEERIYP